MGRTTSSNKKKVLIISYDFPPARSSGVYRPTKFIKHLDRWGWRPIVLTAKNPYVVSHDDSLLADIPSHTAIYRALSPDLLALEAGIYRLLFGNPRAAEDAFPAKTIADRSKASACPANQVSWLKRLIFSPLREFVEDWAYIPDSKFPWYPFALMRALQIVNREEPDIILTTSAPHTAQLVGLTLKLVCRRPWVVDFRDNWVVGYRHNYRDQRRAAVDEWLMRIILRHADQVIAMSEGNAEDIRRHFRGEAHDKVWAIPNGYDEDDFRDLDADVSITDAADDGFVLLHMGTVYGVSYGRFFHALAGLFEEHPELREKIRVDFIGFPTPKCRQLSVDLQLGGIVRFLGFRSHPEALRAMQRADVLLLFLGGEKILNQQYPGKVFEYLRTERPVLTLGDRGEIVDTMRAGGCGVIAHYNHTEEIKAAIKRLYNNKLRGEPSVNPNPRIIGQFEYRALTEKFVEVLETARRQ